MAEPGNQLERHLLRAARRVLRPLVRILLRYGISAGALEQVVRKVYVDVAHEEFGIDGKAQTLARVSVLTGLNRKEVARLRKLPPMDESDGEWWTRAGRVLARWFVDEQYLDRKGDPLDLPFAGPSPSFTDLVKKHSGDMYPRAIADELLRLGAVEEVDGRMRMTRRGYVPTDDPALIIDILGLDTAQFMETVDHNILAGADEKLMQVKVVTETLPIDQVPRFLQQSRREGQRLIEDLADWLERHEDDPDGPKRDAHRVAGFGVYQILSTPASEVGSDDEA